MINEGEIRQQMERLSNEDLISILLRRDGKEWQPEVIEIAGTILSERGLSRGKDLKYTVGSQSALDETEGLDLKTVAEYVSHLDAEADCLILEREGIKAWIFEDDNSPAEGLPPSVQLKVSAEDWMIAMEKLQFEEVLTSDVRDYVDELPCPKCLSRKVIESEEHQELHYHCASCGHTWSEIK